jgi:phosphoserine aminotransferase
MPYFYGYKYPRMNKPHNFSAGPCILPESVLQKASEAVINFDGLNLSLIEVSHRGKNFEAVMERSQQLVKELLGVPEGYQVLFLQGGASLGFLISAYNMMGNRKNPAYINTGTWSAGAIKEVSFTGATANVIASSQDRNFCYIPKDYVIPTDSDYLHITTNNTIEGTQFHHIPETHVPLVADMSSDIFSKQIDVSKFDLIYAGAQKNLGPAGATLYIVKEEAMARRTLAIPTMLDLKKQYEKDSMYNTPPVFSIYVSMLTLEWLKDLGGIGEMERINNEKAACLYAEIDRNSLFKGTADLEDRSKMNVTFVLNNADLEPEFDRLWKEAQISGIRGHRSVGGYRASLYNALPLSSVQALVEVMQNLEKQFG